MARKFSPLSLVNFSTTHRPRSYVNSFVRPHLEFTAQERLDAALLAGWNVFQFPSKMLRGGDLLSDSGTTAMTIEQLAALVLGDEAYGSNWGYFQLQGAIEEVFGIPLSDWELYLFHQCRAAEHALFSHIGCPGLVIPANSFFDTTRANAEMNNITALDLVATYPFEDTTTVFKGNIDLAQLEEVLLLHPLQIPLVYMTITNNTGGGQPVSMENLRATRALCAKYGVAFFLDACRFAENAWFIKRYESACAKRSIAEIVQEQFALADGFTISFKKDGLANMGGALAIKKDSPIVRKYPELLEQVRDHQILVEGHPTYGGLSGRDIMTIAEGLRAVIKEAYLDGRIAQVRDFGLYMRDLGIPLVEPFGGHAVYIDIDRFYADTGMSREDFGGIALTALLLLKGVRLCELGAFAFGAVNRVTGEETYPKHNYVRAALPRNKYERDDLCYVADCVKALYDRRDQIPRAVPVYGRDKMLRHFKARFELRAH